MQIPTNKTIPHSKVTLYSKTSAGIGVRAGGAQHDNLDLEQV